MSEKDQTVTAVNNALDANAGKEGALLPILHHIQDAIGYVPEDGIERIGKSLGLSRAEVHGVISFYHHFRTSPPGKKVIQVCRSEACKSMGVGETALRRWVDQLREERGGVTPNSKALTAEQQEIQALKARINRLELEKKILKEATVSSTGECNILHLSQNWAFTHGNDEGARVLSFTKARALA